MSLIRSARERVTELRLSNNANFEHYVATIYALAEAGSEAVAAAARAVADQFKGRALTIFDKAQAKVSEHVRQAIRGRGAVPQSQLDQWLKEISES